VVRAAAPGGPPRRSPAAPPDGNGPGLSLVVVAPRDDVAVHTPDPASVESLMASGTPHLYAGVVEGTGVVGPLVLPGETGCAGCLYADRTDRDPAWPRLVAQWRSGRPRPVPPCDLTLAATVAGLAAAHALAFLDGGTPAGTGVRWEVSLPALRWHARPVAAHPACPCGAAAEGKQEHIAEDGARGATMAGQGPPSAARHGVGPTRPAGTWRAHV
ncbi:TOMM precursor leader peptide-binding protein, partial [Streptomyces olivaceus]